MLPRNKVGVSPSPESLAIFASTVGYFSFDLQVVCAARELS